MKILFLLASLSLVLVFEIQAKPIKGDSLETKQNVPNVGSQSHLNIDGQQEDEDELARVEQNLNQIHLENELTLNEDNPSGDVDGDEYIYVEPSDFAKSDATFEEGSNPDDEEAGMIVYTDKHNPKQ